MPNDSALINWGHLTRFASNLKDKLDSIGDRIDANSNASNISNVIDSMINGSKTGQLIIQPLWFDGTLSDDGEDVSSSEYVRTDYMPIKTCVLNNHSNGKVYIYRYDEDKTFVRSLTVQANNDQNMAETWSDTAYVRLLTAVGNRDSVTITYPKNIVTSEDLDDINETIDTISDRIDSMGGGSNNIVLTYVDDEYVKNGGAFDTYADWSRTDYIDCREYTDLIITVTGTRTYPYNAFYDESKHYIEMVTLNGGVDNEVHIPDGARYLVLSEATNHLKTGYTLRGFIDISSIGPKPDLPYYYSDIITKRSFDITSVNAELKGESDMFAFITDVHFPFNSGNSGKVISKLINSTALNKVIFGGDVCPAYNDAYPDSTSKRVCLQSIIDHNTTFNMLNNIYQVKGNHDFHIQGRDGSDKYMMNPQSARNQIMSVTSKDVVTDSTRTDGCYYYFDNVQQKIRYIVIDACEKFGENGQWTQVYGVTDEQLDWIVNTAVKTAEDYNFVFISHVSIVDLTSTTNQYSTFSKLKNVIDAIHSHGTAEGYDFTDLTGKVIMFLSGHEHQDLQTYNNGVLHVSVACDAIYQDYKKSPLYGAFNVTLPTKSKGTINEATFDIVAFDTDKVKFLRIGGGNDRTFNLTPKQVSVGGTVTITPTLSGNLDWYCYNASGRTVATDYTMTLQTGKATVSNGVVTGVSTGEAVVVCKDNKNNFELFYVKVV